jgi:hypothetical protein
MRLFEDRDAQAEGHALVVISLPHARVQESQGNPLSFLVEELGGRAVVVATLDKDDRDDWIRLLTRYVDKVSRAEVAMQSPANWAKAKTCHSCGVAFGWVPGKRTHCRVCSQSFCRACCFSYAVMAMVPEPVKCCQACLDSRTSAGKDTFRTPKSDKKKVIAP